ncbi:MAG TPA: LptE family protein [Bacteroidia bacterium]|nr:LptE family protein [Bacteroidia bacterium]HNT80465.1 LptE family protein [Bacteroidia bacterium]
MQKTFYILSIVSVMIFSGLSCGIYSFTGASISPDIKTFSVQYFPNKATIVQPVLSQLFTDKLKEKFINQTSLSLTEKEGDLQFEGYISNYQTVPIAIQSSEQAAQNRLSISVWVRFKNSKSPSNDFETTFTRYTDYSSSINLTLVETDLINEINRQIIDDIFNKAVVNW